MPETPITVTNLRKVYRVHEREEGLGAAVKSVFARRFKEVAAVDDISFEIGAGEVVGFLGPNGAGKTTTLKMLSGLLHPDGGDARVLGHTPWKRERSYLQLITLVMGQRSQLLWDIPAADSLLVLREVYNLSDAQYRRTLDDLIGLLDMGDLLHKPVRNLSLGERMKVEFAAALIHGPKVLFLDEPTIGLDVTMQSRIRSFVAEYNARTGASILLTSHYMDDIVALCRRVIVIHHGKLLYDGGLADLAARLAPHKLIGVTLTPGTPVDFERYGEVVDRQELRVTIKVPREAAPDRTAQIVGELRDRLADLSLEDPPIEEVIDRVFSAGEALESEPAAR